MITVFLVAAGLTQQSTPKLEDTRVSVELRDLPFEEAMMRVLTPFRMDIEWLCSRKIDRKVSIHLENAGFWKAVDALCEAGSITPVTTPYHGLVMANRYYGCGASSLRSDFCDKGPVRVAVIFRRYDHPRDPPEYPVSLRVIPMFPPGTPVADVKLLDLRVFGDSGEGIPTLPEGMLDTRVWGPETGWIRWASLSPMHVLARPDIRGPMTVEGVLALKLNDGSTESIAFAISAAPSWELDSPTPSIVPWASGSAVVLLLSFVPLALLRWWFRRP